MKPTTRKLTPQHLITLGMMLPVVLMLLVGFLQWKSVQDYRESREWASHTRTVLLHMETFLSCINDAETGQRGYLLTHKESYLQPYDHALTCNRDEIKILRQLTGDNQVQQSNIDRLEPLVNAKFDELAQTVALERSSDHAGALKLVMTDMGKNTMDQIRTVLRDMHTVQQDLLQQREEVYQQSARMNAMLSMLLIATGFCSVVSIIFLLRRMERMQSMITICAWSKLIEYEGQWLTVEEYLSRRLNARVTHGISRVEAEKMLKLLEVETQKKAA